jgi:putative hydrolase of the HAD superfamily
MIKLIAFDLGETLINYKGLSLDWSSHYEKALRYACDNLSIVCNDSMISNASLILLKYNTRINPRSEEVSAQFIFSGILKILKSGGEGNEPFVEKFFEYFQRESEPEDSALELLRYLKNQKIKTAVLTDVPYGMPKEFVLKDLKSLDGFIDLTVTSEEVGFRKPETIGLTSIMNHFQTLAAETIYVGNERKDIEMADTLGVFSVLLKKGGVIPDWGQQKSISKLIEIKSLFYSAGVKFTPRL